jgi:magnesium transporter
MQTLPEAGTENVWVDCGPDDLATLAPVFGLHELAVEDSLKEWQYPKVEDFDSYLFVITYVWQGSGPQRLSLFIGGKIIISVHADDLSIKSWIDTELKLLKAPAQVAYWLLDRSVDSFFAPVDALEEEIEDAGDIVLRADGQDVLVGLFDLRRRLLDLRRIISGEHAMLRQVLSLQALGSNSQLRHYFLDIHDHVSRLVEVIEANRELLAVTIETYLSAVANRTNDTMRVLTVIATIFMPLTFIAGVYGMNFRYMPEIAHPYGYPAVMLGMLALSLGMVLYFRRKKWF